MSNVFEPIVISSGEENEVVIIKEIPGEKEMDVKPDVSNFRLNSSKLKALKSRRSRNRLRSTTNIAIESRPCETVSPPVIKSSPLKLQIDSKKLKKLRADLKIKLEQNPNSKLAKRVKKEEQSVKL